MPIGSGWFFPFRRVRSVNSYRENFRCSVWGMWTLPEGSSVSCCLWNCGKIVGKLKKRMLISHALLVRLLLRLSGVLRKNYGKMFLWTKISFSLDGDNHTFSFTTILRRTKWPTFHLENMYIQYNIRKIFQRTILF